MNTRLHLVLVLLPVIGLPLVALSSCRNRDRGTVVGVTTAPDSTRPEETRTQNQYRNMVEAAVSIRVKQSKTTAVSGKVITTPIAGIGAAPEIATSTRMWPQTRAFRSSYLADYGAGVLFQAPDVVLTSARLVRGREDITLFTQRHQEGVPGRVMLIDEMTGLALVKAARPLGEGVSERAQSANLGGELILVGSPGGLLPSLSWSRVARTEVGVMDAPGLPVVQLEGASPRGFEGGPAFDAAGRLAGIVLNWPVTVVSSPGVPASEIATASVVANAAVAFLVPVTHEAVWKRLMDLAEKEVG